MTLPRHQKLRQKASLALRSGDFASALRVYEELERLEPEDPTWPERQASAHHALGAVHEELACLRRSLDLLVDQGQVLAAIATCRLILDVRPDDPAALERLDDLYGEAERGDPPSREQDAAREPRPGAPAGRSDAPLEELELTDVIRDARAIRLGDGDEGGVAEIPLDDSASDASEAVAELEVDWLDTVGALDAPAPPGRADAARAAPEAPRAKAPASVRVAREALGRTPLFGALDVDALRRVLAEVDVVELGAGAVLFREGDAAETLYVVVSGAVVPVAEGPPRRRMAVLEEGDFFGEIGLVTNRPRNATVEALVETRLLAIDRHVVWALIRSRPEVSKVVLRFLRERLVDRTLHTHPFFAPFDRRDAPDLARGFRFLEVRDGSTLVEQGEPARGLFILLAGGMDVVDEERRKRVGRLEPGDLFGGVALVRRAPSAASVIAAGKCWVLVLPEPTLRGVLARRPGLEDRLRRAPAPGAGGRPAV